MKLSAVAFLLGTEEVSKLQPVMNNETFPERTGETYHGANLHEASGIVASHRHAGVFWIIRDGIGNPDPVRVGYRRTVLAVRFDQGSGKLVRWPKQVSQTSCDGFVKCVYLKRADGTPVHNIDIEDVALDPAQNCLWLGNIGNNPHEDKPGELFRFPEPDPLSATEVRADLSYRYSASGINSESLFLVDGVPHLLVKTAPKGSALRQGQVLKLPLPTEPGVVDAVPLSVLQPPNGSSEHNFKPTGADLRDGKLLVARANGWLRYEADPALHGDELVKALAAAPPKVHRYWEPDHALVATEAIAWTHPPLADSFLSLSETGQFRWVREGA
ncbi:hypothetical protein [Allokutzneria albata]|uniref:Uncharacterized protein n=1 Tax=Allokutzneria albata TaxID=211114 RepID=A0A1G9T722_ALLAB|nr:hypothetical protein [Allokutzneria albata]SDM43448.1 hypothetical protein SAMN04489726_1599 [Allokutzneria albata]